MIYTPSSLLYLAWDPATAAKEWLKLLPVSASTALLQIYINESLSSYVFATEVNQSPIGSRQYRGFCGTCFGAITPLAVASQKWTRAHTPCLDSPPARIIVPQAQWLHCALCMLLNWQSFHWREVVHELANLLRSPFRHGFPTDQTWDLRLRLESTLQQIIQSVFRMVRMLIDGDSFCHANCLSMTPLSSLSEPSSAE